MTVKLPSRFAAVAAALSLGVTFLVASPALAEGSVGAGTYEESATAISRTGTWSKLANAADSGGASAYAQSASAFEIRFTGTAVSWVGRKSASSGIALVTLDGQNVGDVDRYAASNLFQVKLFERADLTPGEHVLRVEWTGQKNAAATGTSIHLDSVIVQSTQTAPDPSSAVAPGSYEETHAAFSYTGKWAPTSSGLDSGGASTSLSSVGSAQFSFTGTSLQVFGRKSPSGGIARVVVDGAVVGQFDRYSRTSEYQQLLFQSGQLPSTAHSVSIEWTGQKNTASGGTSIHLDRIKVLAGPEAIAGPGIHEELSALVSFTGPWTTSTSTADSGGASSYSSSTSSVSLRFNGNAVKWIGRTSASSGIASVKLDDRPAVDIDRYSATSNYQQTLFRATGLAAGAHTLTVSWTGRKNASASSTAVHFDAFQVSEETQTPVVSAGVYGEDSPAIIYEGAWFKSLSSGDQGGKSVYASGAARASLTFEGTGIAWIARRTANSGIASVTLDGVAQPDVDRYSAATTYQESVFVAQGLAPGRHTITLAYTGRNSAQATGLAIHLDAFVVSNLSTTIVQGAQATALDPASTAGSGVETVSASLAWNAVSGFSGESLKYTVRRTSDGTSTDIATTSATTFQDVGLDESTRYSYSVVAKSAWGFTSQPSSEVIRTTGSLDPETGEEHCARPTVVVANGTQLRTALAAAGPGSVIELADGVFRGTGRSATEFNGFSLTGIKGTSSQPVVICGSDNAVVELSDNSTGYSGAATAFAVTGSSWVRFENVRIANVFSGFEIVGSSNIVISGATVTNTGQAGVYLHKNSSDNTVIGSTISGTGRKDARFGEGIYVGSSLDNDTCQPNCPTDRSDRNVLAFNTITGAASEPIETKEQTTGGLIYRNQLGATEGTSSITLATLQIKGSHYLVYGNEVSTSLNQGIRVLSASYTDGMTWGTKNVLARNTITFTGAPSSDAVAIYGFNSSETVIKCSNIVAPTSVKLAPAPCTR